MPDPVSVPDECLKVFYDGACPLCTAEIGFYRRQPGAEAIEFVDISDTSSPLPAGVSRAEALARFHVETPRGTAISGAAAFGEVMTRLKHWRLPARLLRLPVFRTLAELAYRAFLRHRPGIVALFVRLSGRHRR